MGKKQETMDQFNRYGSPAEEVFWFAINENTHRAVSIFSFKESYKEIKQKSDNMRKEASSNMNISMTFEAYGLARVTKTGS